MNLDRKFLEGFSEVSAANGLPPSQAHQLLMKEAKFGSLAKILGLGTVVAAPTVYFGGKALLDKANEGLINFGNRQKDYYGGGVYGVGAPPSITNAPSSAPHYTSWGEDTSLGNNQWGTSGSTTASPSTTSTSPNITPMQFPSDAKAFSQAQRQYDLSKMNYSTVNRQIEEANKAAARYRQRIQNPNFIREIPILGGMYENYTANALQQETDRLKQLAEQQRQYESAYNAADRARENAMK
jgi:hypothetical protein